MCKRWDTPEELLDALEPVAVHDMRDERIPLTLPELVEDGLSDALPVFRLVPGLDRMAQSAGDGKSLLGCFRCADNFRGADDGSDGNAERFDDLERIPEPPYASLLRELRRFGAMCSGIEVRSTVEAKARSRLSHTIKITSSQIGKTLAEIIQQRRFRQVRIGQRRVSMASMFKDIDQIIRLACGLAFQTSVCDKPQEVAEQRRCLHRRCIAVARGKFVEADVVEIGGVRQHVAYFTLRQPKPVDELQ